MVNSRLGSEQLLERPRGRRLCLELVRLIAHHHDDEASRQLLTQLAMAAYERDPDRVQQAGERPDTGSLDELAEALHTLPLVELDHPLLFSALSMAVSCARYWQEPDGDDVLASDLNELGALTRFADHIASSGYSLWWTAPCDLQAQRLLWWPEYWSPPDLQNPTEVLQQWREEELTIEERAAREFPTDPTARLSGTWWSIPPTTLAHTSGELAGYGPVGCDLVEDAAGWNQVDIVGIDVPEHPTVYEIDAPADWIELCRRLPLKVPASRRHDWYRATGSDHEWVIPDWSAVARQYGAAHLTVRGYLTTAGRALQIDDRGHSVLAGWAPGDTFWFVPVSVTKRSRQHWARVDHPFLSIWEPTSD